MPQASSGLVIGFIFISLVLAGGWITAIFWSSRTRGLPAREVRRQTLRATLGTAVWMTATGLAAARGLIHFDSMPPTMVVLFLLIVGLVVALGTSELGYRLATTIPLAVLVGWQAFRLPLELMMHRAAAEGIMPPQMSYSGLNYDIVTGATALIVAPLIAVGRAPRWLVLGWNTMGLLLVLTVITIGFLSAPIPIRIFHNEPSNVWITHFPFVWLPAVMVAMALLGHVLIFRRLRHDRTWSGSATPCSQPALVA